MKLTRKIEYAIKILLGLSPNYKGKLMLSKDIAQQQDLPEKFVPQIINDLARSGLVYASRGIGGGISLAKDPKNISVKNVIEAIEGPIAINFCLVEPGLCDDQFECQLFGLWSEAQKRMVEVFEEVTIKDLVDAKFGVTQRSKNYLIPEKIGAANGC